MNMPNIDFSYMGLMSALSILLSLLFQYFPGLKDWYTKLQDNQQKLIMLGALVVLDAALFGLNCAGIVTGAQCTKEGGMQLVYALVIGIVSNQGIYQILPNPNKQ